MSDKAKDECEEFVIVLLIVLANLSYWTVFLGRH